MKKRIKPKSVFKSVKHKNLIRELAKVHLNILKKINYFKGEEL
jgi:hypothetical protein